jgi:DNA-binding CsgD family transcriptional regulator
MRSESELLELVRLAYGTAGSGAGWSHFLERYRRALGGSCVTLHHWDGTTRDSPISASAGPAADEAVRQYHAYYGALNPHFHQLSANLSVGAVTLSHELYPVEKLLQTEYYNDYLRRLDLECVIGAPLLRRNGAYAHISCLRPFRHGLYAGPEVGFVRRLIPHLHRAVRIHMDLGELRLDHRSEADALDRVTAAVLVVAPDGRLRLANAAAERLLASRDGLTLAGDGLRASHATETRALRTLIMRAARGARGELVEAGGVLRISRPSGKRPLSVLVAPTQPPLAYPRLQRGCVLLLVRDPAEVVTGSILRRRYGLTATEGKLAEQLVSGETLESASAALVMTRETARSHVKAILRKSGVNRQSDFVRVATASLAAQVRADRW